ncbi:hypothetical protein STANM309S_02335 [Streptomyces tanashiensis]
MTPITEVEGRRLALSNLDKVLHPLTGTTKGEVLHYYATVGAVILPHLRLTARCPSCATRTVPGGNSSSPRIRRPAHPPG